MRLGKLCQGFLRLRRRTILVRCLDCHETFRAHPDDLTHDEREDGSFCGGDARPLARWEWT